MATFPGKGSDDAVEQTDGRMQTGCCLLLLPVKFEENHIFPCISVKSENELIHFCQNSASDMLTHIWASVYCVVSFVFRKC